MNRSCRRMRKCILSFVLTVAIVLGLVMVDGRKNRVDAAAPKIPIAYYCDGNKTVYFLTDTQTNYDTATTYNGYAITRKNCGDYVTRNGMEDQAPQWTDNDQASMKPIQHVVIEPSFSSVKVRSLYCYFALNNLLDITGLNYLDTSNVINMADTFSRCKQIKVLDLTGFDTSKVRNMISMFDGCENLEHIYYDSTKFVTSGLTGIDKSRGMFYECKKLRGYDSNYTDHRAISALMEDPSQFRYYIAWCVDNKTLYFFGQTDAVNEGDEHNGKTITTLYNGAAEFIKEESYPSWCNNQVAKKAKNVVIESSFSGARTKTCRMWFSDFNELVSITGLEYLNTSNVTTMHKMFTSCWKLPSLDLSSFDISKVNNMDEMFSFCHKLSTIKLNKNWDLSRVNSSIDMFYKCYALEGCEGTKYSSNHLDKTYAHIDEGPSNPGYFSDGKTPATAPTITVQPVGEKSLVYGESGEISVTVTPADDTDYTLTYQWYKNESASNEGGAKINGATSATYVLPNDNAVGDYYYYCEVTATRKDNSKRKTVRSSVSTVTVTQKAVTVKANDQTVELNGNLETGTGQATLTGAVDGHTLDSVTLTFDPDSTANATTNGTIMPSNAVIKNSNTDVTSNYNITYAAGTLTVSKADPNPENPTGLTATYGQKLSDVYLPSGWAWDEPDTSVGDVGENTFSATYTPTDTDNYNTKTENLNVTVNKADNPAQVEGTAFVVKGGNTVDLSSSVSGAQGDISYSITGALTGCSVNKNTGIFTSGTTTGDCTVTVTIAGNADYYETTKTIIVTVGEKFTQTISFKSDTQTKTYGDADFTVVATHSVGDGTVTYAVADGKDVVTVDDTGKVHILKVGTAIITAKAATTNIYSEASAQYTLTVNPKLITIPTAVTGLKWTGNVQTGVADGSGYTVTNGKATDVDSYTAKATLTDKNNTKWNNGSTEDQSIAWSISKADGTTAPTGLIGTAPTTDGGSDGKISGVDSTMEYSDKTDFASNIDCTGTEITGLSAGTYYVRVKETTTHEAGAYATVTVPAYVVKFAKVKKAPTPKANLVYDGSSMTLVEQGDAENGTMVYAVTKEGDSMPDSQLYTKSIPVETDAGIYTVYYYIKGDGDHEDDGSAKEPKGSVEITIKKAGQDKPAETFTSTETSDENTADGKINGFDKAKTYQYSADNGNTWTDVEAESTEIEVKSGTYQIRYAEDKNHEAGQAVTVIVEVKAVEKATETPTEKSTEKQNDKPAEKSTDKPTDKQTDKQNEKSKTVKKDGVGTISADGKTLTDTDGVKYIVAEKLKAKQLKKNAKIADKKSAGKYKITKVTKKNGKITGGTVTYMKPYNKNCKKANVKASIKLSGATFKVTAIADKAFKNCENLKKVTIKQNVKTIGKYAFAGCINLTNVKCTSKGLKKIGVGAFSGDAKLTQITLKTTKLKKKTVGKNAVKGTPKNLKISAPKKVKKSYQKIFRSKGNKRVIVK